MKTANCSTSIHNLVIGYTQQALAIFCIVSEHEYYYCATDDIFIEWKNTANVKCECNEMAKK